MFNPINEYEILKSNIEKYNPNSNFEFVKKAFDFIGAESVITDNPETINACDKILLPGVGSFGDAMDSMHKSGLVETVKQNALSGKPFLGICLGLQLLFEESEESPGVKGLGIFKGKIKKFSPDMGLKIPHIGWNALIFPKDREKSKLFKYINEGDCVYFVHSYAGVDCDDFVSSRAEYGAELTASVECGNVYGTQFHPEKSGEVGLKILKAFCEL